jgi:hypothetical protein
VVGGLPKATTPPAIIGVLIITRDFWHHELKHLKSETLLALKLVLQDPTSLHTF